MNLLRYRWGHLCTTHQAYKNDNKNGLTPLISPHETSLYSEISTSALTNRM
jgi:hypothetical protein